MMSSNIITFPPNGDDYIGTESCMDLQNENDVVIDHLHDTSKFNDAPAQGNQTQTKVKSKKKEKRVFPPPIPLLAQTQNLASHMPWVLKRYYTSEGRLILKEEKVKHHEYFRAHRANGRLTLQLVPLDDDDDDDYFLGTNEVEAPPTSPHEEKKCVTTIKFADEENMVNGTVVDGVLVENENGVGAGGNGRLKCLNCSSVRSAPSSIFGVPVHPIRTVQG